MDRENHQYYKNLLMGFMDDELSKKDKESLGIHLKGCPECREELKEFNKIKGVMKNMKYKEPPDEAWQRYWSKIYNRLERGLGWILTSIGAMILLFYGGYKAVESLIKDPALAVFLKVAILVLIAGIVILFVSVLRERIFTFKKDKYAKEVKR